MREHIRHLLIEVDCGSVGECKLNVRTGRIRYGVSVLSVGDGNFGIEASLVYAPYAQYPDGIQTHVGNGWKLNLQEYFWRISSTQMCYTDASGISHTFAKYKVVDGVEYYHDTSGMYLTATVTPTTSTIIDTNDNQKVFVDNKIVSSVSGINREIVKDYKYKADGRLSQVYDTRMPKQILSVGYSEDNTSYSVLHYDDQTIVNYVNMYLDDKECLHNITKYIVGPNNTYIADVLASYVYNQDREMTAIHNGQRKSDGVVFEYALIKEDGMCRLSKISTCRFDYGSSPTPSSWFAIGGAVASQQVTITNRKGLKLNYYFDTQGCVCGILEDVGNDVLRSMHKTGGFAFGQKGSPKSNWLGNILGNWYGSSWLSSIVQSQLVVVQATLLNISMEILSTAAGLAAIRLALASLPNSNNIASATIEAIRDEVVARQSMSSTQLNGKYAIAMGVNGLNYNTTALINDNVPSELVAICNSSSTNNVRYHNKNRHHTLSLWVNGSILAGGRAICTMTIGGKTHEYYAWLCNTTGGWQQVHIPLDLTGKVGQLSSFALKIDKMFGDVKVADLRIVKSTALTNIYARGRDANSQGLNGAIEIGWDRHASSVNGVGTTQSVVSPTMFVSESDMHYNLINMGRAYYTVYPGNMYAKEFDVVYCNGTKRAVANSLYYVEMFTPTSSTMVKKYFRQNSYGIACYWVREELVGENNWCTEIKEYAFRMDDKCYLTCHVGYKDKSNRYTYTESWVGNPTVTKSQIGLRNGLVDSTIDGYKVTTTHEYDSYGNLLSTVQQASGDSEQLKTTLQYDSTDPKLRQRVTKITHNGITTEIGYDNSRVHGLPTTHKTLGTSPIVQGVTYNTQYSTHGDRLMGVDAGGLRQEITYSNNDVYIVKDGFRSLYIGHNPYGDIQSLTDSMSGLSVIKTTARGKREEVPDKGEQEVDVVESKSNEYYSVKTYIDKYDRILVEETDGNALVYNYEYEKDKDMPHSAAASLLVGMEDRYTNQTYAYNYDEYGRATGYSTTQGKARSMSVVSSDMYSDQLTYAYDSSVYAYKTIYEDNQDKGGVLVNPRVRQSEVYFGDEGKVKDKLERQSREYEYDKLGRLCKTSQTHKDQYTEGSARYEQYLDIGIDRHYKHGTTQVEREEYRVNNDTKGTMSSSTTGKPTVVESSRHTSIKYQYKYDQRGNLLSSRSCGNGFGVNVRRHGPEAIVQLSDRQVEYEYDGLDRVVVEREIVSGKHTMTVRYSYDESGGVSKIDNEYVGSTTVRSTAEFDYRTYSNASNTQYRLLGRKSGKRISNKTLSYDSAIGSSCSSGRQGEIRYDTYGNVVHNLGYDVEWFGGNTLQRYRGVNNSYNRSGVRYKKDKANGNVVYYHMDGDKVMGEEHSDGSRIHYVYDGRGVVGCRLRYRGESEWYDYGYVRDVQGNVVKIMYREELQCEYEYDICGNVVSRWLNRDRTERAIWLMENNGYRWKGYYWDVDMELYRIGSRWYDPQIEGCLDALSPELMMDGVGNINGLDRYVISRYNTVLGLGCNVATQYTSVRLYSRLADYQMEAGASDVDVPSSWWGDNWLYVAAGVTLVAGVVLSLVPGTQGLGIGLLVAGSKAAISGAIVGGVIGGLSAVVTGNDSLQGLSRGAVDGLLSGFVLGSVLYAGGVAVGAMRARVPGTKNGYNFASAEKLDYHYTKHGVDMGYSSPQAYLKDANYVIVNGQKFAVTHGEYVGVDAYIRFLGQGKKYPKFAYVGMTHNGKHIATFHVKGVPDLMGMNPAYFDYVKPDKLKYVIK